MKTNLKHSDNKTYKGVIVAVVVGTVSVLINRLFRQPLLDPLVIAIVLGMLLRNIISFNTSYQKGFNFAAKTFIPIGVIFYGACNLNFSKMATINPVYYSLLLFVFFIYIISTIVLSKIFRLSDKECYLIATGSAVCGASAIAITSQAIDAEPKEVSCSLLSVFIAALVGLLSLYHLFLTV